MISKRTESISQSLTLAISAKAKAMKREGIDVIGFGAGEPDFDTPLHIKEKAKQAIDDGYTKYTPASGNDELKQAIISKMKRDSNLEYQKDEVIIGCGAKHVIFEVIFSLVNSGDEVIVPSPFWLSYPEMVKLSDGRCRFIETKQEDNFKVRPQALEEAISSKAKIFILNSPSNPTGMVYTKEELGELAEIIEKKKIICISDEIYERLIYDNLTFTSIASLSDAMKQKTIVINGVSKSYSMTGWRIGYGCGSKEIISSMAKVQSHTTSNPTSISQVASIEALQGSQDEVTAMRDEFRTRRDYMIEKVNKIENLSVKKPQGAFYCFVNISKCLGKKLEQEVISDSLKFAGILLEKAKVAVVPGVVFGNDNYIRLSYATSLENIKKGLDRVEEFVGRLI